MVIPATRREAVIVVKPVPSLRVVLRISLPMLRSSFLEPAIVFIAIVAAIAGLAVWNGKRPPLPMIELTLPAESALQPWQTPRVPERIVYPYSVVPGGVADPPAAVAAAAGDPVVGLHYAGFNLQRAAMVDNSAPLFAHVSYRRADHIFWTRNKIRIPRGERLLTDGTNLIRARCGNRIADRAEGEIEPVEEAVSDRVLDEPIFEQEPEDHAPLEHHVAQPQPVVSENNIGLLDYQWGSLSGPGFIYSSSMTIWPPAPPKIVLVETPGLTFAGPVIGGIVIPQGLIATPGEPRPPSEDPETPVPEPSSSVLVILGLAGGFLLYRRRV